MILDILSRKISSMNANNMKTVSGPSKEFGKFVPSMVVGTVNPGIAVDENEFKPNSNGLWVEQFRAAKMAYLTQKDGKEESRDDDGCRGPDPSINKPASTTVTKRLEQHDHQQEVERSANVTIRNPQDAQCCSLGSFFTMGYIAANTEDHEVDQVVANQDENMTVESAGTSIPSVIDVRLCEPEEHLLENDDDSVLSLDSSIEDEGDIWIFDHSASIESFDDMSALTFPEEVSLFFLRDHQDVAVVQQPGGDSITETKTVEHALIDSELVDFLVTFCS